MRRVRLAAAATAAVLAVTLAGCSEDGPDTSSPGTSTADPTPGASTDPSAGGEPTAQLDLEEAVSEPVEDSYYPDYGDPGVDALHYDLALTWRPQERVLDGTETLTFRAAATAAEVRLALDDPLAVSSVELDGAPVEVTREGDTLVVHAPVTQDQEYVLRLAYSGQPQPVAAPTGRQDTGTVGFTVTDDGEVWTMQEPYGAFTWYAVNDQPSDKALYDVRISVDSPWVGVSNGELLSRTEADGVTTTRWRLDEPAAAYLMTLAIGDYQVTEDVLHGQAGDIPITYWVPRDRAYVLERLQRTPEVFGWVEDKLGPYPFDSLGIVVVDSTSGMETQTMITLGYSEYATSRSVLLHEIVHQWYGDLVTPEDWRDLWMNEGMAMYLQGMWEDEDTGATGWAVREWRHDEPRLRAQAGPPGAYDADAFAESNVYFGPALMWADFRGLVGEETFWRLVREWPQEHAGGNASREEYFAWLEAETGRELDRFFDRWLMSPTSPAQRRR